MALQFLLYDDSTNPPLAVFVPVSNITCFAPPVATTVNNGIIKQATALVNTGGSTLTNSSGGTIGTIVASIGALFSQSAIQNNFASLTDTVNKQKAQQDELIANLKSAGVLHL